MAQASTPTRQHRDSSLTVRRTILEAAAVEFAAHGFEGASTRAIAQRSRVHQAQIGYHVGSKDELWRATVDFLFDRLRAELDRALPADMDVPTPDPVGAFAEVIRRHVRHTATHPELSRMMLMETAHKTDRVGYLLTKHVRPTMAALELIWSEVRHVGRGGDMTAEEVFMFMIGLAPIPFAQAGMMRTLLGAQRCTPTMHAESMIKWILR